jgi:hypothetical protein
MRALCARLHLPKFCVSLVYILKRRLLAKGYD